MNYLSVTDVIYKGGYRLEISFSNSEKKLVDFEPFLIAHPHPQYNAYKDLSLFQSFSIENGNLVWGKDWDLIFPVTDLYSGRIA